MLREHLLRCAIGLGLGLGSSMAYAQSAAPEATSNDEAAAVRAETEIPAGDEVTGSQGAAEVPAPQAAAQQATTSTAMTTPATGSRPAQTGATAPTTEEAPLNDEQVLFEEEEGTEPTYSRVHPHERRNQNYNFLGVFYRYQFLPASIVELFVQSAPSFNFPQMGIEYIHRRNNFDIIASAYYADFEGSGPFLGKDDPTTNIEWIESSLWAVMGSVTFLWSTSFSDWFALEAGVGIGVGALLGDVRRNEAYPTDDGYAACVPPTAAGAEGTAQPDQGFSTEAAANGETIGQYCAPPNNFPSDSDGQEGEHYGINARHWFDGGKVPNLWFRVAPQVSLRFKPMHQLVLRVDGGFDIFSGIFVGAAAAIGF